MSYLATLLYGYRQVNLSGSALAQRSILNFTGTGVTAVDNPATGATDVTITAGGSGSALTALTADVVAIGPGVASAEVQAIRGRTVASTVPSDAGLYVYASPTSTWNPVVMTGDATMDRTGDVTVVGLQGYPVSTTAPTSGDVLAWNPSGPWYAPTPNSGTPLALGGGLRGTTANGYAIGNPFGCITLEEYGAVGDGVTDDSAAYTAAIAALNAAVSVGTGPRTIRLGANRTYLVTGYTGQLPSGGAVEGEGYYSALKCLSNKAIVDGPNTGVFYVSNCQLIGTFGAGANNHGINGHGCSGAIISDVWVTTPGGSGVYFTAGDVAQNGPQIVNVNVYVPVNKAGIYLDGMNYAQVINCKGYGGTYGIYIDAGNANVVGCVFNNNTHGAWIDNVNGNDGHGIMVGCAFNHCVTNAIHVDPLVNGFNFRDCHAYYAAITVDGNTGSGKRSIIRFQNCTIDVDSTTATDADVRFEGCTWPMENANTFITASGGTIRFDDQQLKLDATPMAVDSTSYAGSTNTQSWVFGNVTRGLIDGNHGVIKAGGGGSDFATYAGPLTGSETAYAALWLLGNATARSSTNPSIYSDGSGVVINSPHPLAFGTISLYAAGSALMAQFDPLNGTALISYPTKFSNQSAPSTPTGGPYVYGSGGHLYSVNTDGDTFQLS